MLDANFGEKYAEWVKDSCACCACESFAPNSTKYLVNLNIRGLVNNQPMTLPQSGYLGENYDRHRLLVIGLNPAWPRSTLENEKYYELINGIQDSSSLAAVTPALVEAHNKWTVLKNLDLFRQIGVKPSEIAYTNHILCRTDTGDLRHPLSIRGRIGKIQGTDLEPIFDSCLANRLVRLIEILEPMHIIAVGELRPRILEAFVNDRNSRTLTATRVWPAPYPYSQRGIQNAHHALAGLAAILHGSSDSTSELPRGATLSSEVVVKERSTEMYLEFFETLFYRLRASQDYRKYRLQKYLQVGDDGHWQQLHVIPPDPVLVSFVKRSQVPIKHEWTRNVNRHIFRLEWNLQVGGKETFDRTAVKCARLAESRGIVLDLERKTGKVRSTIAMYYCGPDNDSERIEWVMDNAKRFIELLIECSQAAR